MVLKRRNPVASEAFRSGAGTHQRNASGERKQLEKELLQAVDDYLADEFEESDEAPSYPASNRQQLDEQE